MERRLVVAIVLFRKKILVKIKTSMYSKAILQESGNQFTTMINIY